MVPAFRIEERRPYGRSMPNLVPLPARSPCVRATRTRRGRITLGLWLVAMALSLLLLVDAARGGGQARKAGCTHGVSSIGPMVIAKGEAFRGSTTPHTQACLP
jgi:hypothetical protein